MLKIGSHVSMNGKEMYYGSVKEALSYGATTFMVYTGAPQNTRRKKIEDLQIDKALTLMEEKGINPSDIVIHAPYIMNLANPDPVKRGFAIDFFVEELKRAHAMKAPQIVLHPGAHVKEGTETGLKYIIDSLNKVIEKTPDIDTLIALETMAGKGTEVGKTFEEIRAIIDGVTNDERLSVCFDTCHTHDAGYDVADDFVTVLDEFDRIVGKKRISVLHINDSKNVKGAAKDRHENIGFGNIGFDALNAIVHHKDFKDIPKILETPFITETDDSKKRLYPPYKEEIEMFRTQEFDPHLIEKIRKEKRS